MAWLVRIYIVSARCSDRMECLCSGTVRTFDLIIIIIKCIRVSDGR